MHRLLLVLTLIGLTASVHATEVAAERGGITLHAEFVTVGADWKAGPVILMTHGTLAHNKMEIMRALQKAFRERGFSSLSINLGYNISNRTGMYDCAVPHTHRHTDAVDEIGFWLDWLKGHGVQSVVLLGHSRGGNQTARFAASHDDPLIRAVVLIAPPHWSERYANEGYQHRYGKPLAPVLAEAERLVKAGKGDTMMKPVDLIYCADTSATAASFVSYYRPDPLMDTPTVLAQVDAPVLVFAGSEDTVVPHLEQKMAEVAQRENITLQVIEGADHFFRDLYTEDAADAAVAFIEEQR